MNPDLFLMMHPGSSGLGLKPRPLTSYPGLFTQPHALSGVFVFPDKHHNPPSAGKGRSRSQSAGGSDVCRSDGGGISRLFCSLLRPGNVTNLIHIMGVLFFSFETMISMFKIITLNYL